ncbi:MAG: glycoside hydrolase family 88 protein [bacterium]|nr:glycoside hydrolase family 88 protein [bacterium]
MTERPVTPLAFAQLACETMMKKFDAENLPPVGHFHYHQGVFLCGLYQTYQLTGDERYFSFIQRWVDSLINAQGNITGFNPGQLDDLQPGVLLFPLYERTKDPRYKYALDTIAYFMEHFPRTPEGGFWHKAWYRNQMWLDGLYMAGPFMSQYGAEFDKPAFLDEVANQAAIMEKVTRDDKTGLWYHAWDYERLLPWADKETGRSPEFWGRALGWAPVAILEDLRFFPENHPQRRNMERMACDLLKALLPYQDQESGLWYQVVDKGDDPNNWLESSCTCLYTAAICRAVHMGLMDEKYLEAARKGFEGVTARLGYDDNGVMIGNICIGTGVGDYAHYLARPTSVNDLHGAGAFLLMCTEAAQVL